MKFSIGRDELLRPLQMVHSVVERRQTLPILANVHLVLKSDTLQLTATDLEVELSCRTEVKSSAGPAETTLPARKLLDLCRATPEGVVMDFSVDAEKAVVRAGKARFSLATMAAQEFPSIDVSEQGLRLNLSQRSLKELLESVHFAMAQQDVRYYLNGMLLEVSATQLRAVATDGHRMAINELPLSEQTEAPSKAIVPRKTIMEMLRLLGDDDKPVTAIMGADHLVFRFDALQFKSKLIDGAFPEYDRVIPHNADQVITADRAALRDVLNRVAIFSNEKYRAVRLEASPGSLRVAANNAENEEAEEELEVEFAGEGLEVGFNVGYLQDVLGALSVKRVEIKLADASSSCLLQALGEQGARYIIMPMRL